MAFPSLTYGPNSIVCTPHDNTLRSPTDAGYVQTRRRSTHIPCDYDVTALASASDLAALISHYRSAMGDTIFTWRTISVRYTKYPISTETPDLDGNYTVQFSVQSV